MRPCPAPRRRRCSGRASPASFCTPGRTSSGSRASPTARSGPTRTGSTTQAPRSSAATSPRWRPAGINAVRVYTVPPRWLLDAAQRPRPAGHGRVAVGAARRVPRRAAARGRDRGSACAAQRAAVRRASGACSCYAVGNEIPASIVRWHGRRRVERFLRRLYDAVKARGSGGAGHLRQLSVDRVPRTSRSSISSASTSTSSRRSGSQPTSRGCRTSRASGRCSWPRSASTAGATGEAAQARQLDVAGRAPRSRRAAPARSSSPGPTNGTAAAYDIDDWDFGLTDARARARSRRCAAVRRSLREVPFPAETHWPRVSVVVCSYNGARTIRDTLEGLRAPRVSRLRGDRRQRRLDRRDAGDRRASTTCG